MSCINLTDQGIDPNAGKPVGAALNALFNGSRREWYLPSGEYLVEETLRLPSGTRLRLAPDACLRLADGAAKTKDDYLLTNADPIGGDRDIEIEGGVFDGNQKGNPRPEGLMTVGYTGAMLHFRNVRGLRLSKAVFRNAEAYYSRYTHVHDFHIEDIGFDSDLVRNNNDGIHLGGNCSNGVIRKLRALRPGVPNDDLVAVNADDALERNEVRGMTDGDIQDLLIEDLEAHSCHSFVRLLCVRSSIRRVTIRGIRGGCQVAAFNADGARGCRVPVFDEADPPFPDGVGLLEDILAEDIAVHKTRDAKTALVDLQERVKNFRIRGFRRALEADQAPSTPTLRLKHFVLENGRLNGASIGRLNLLAPNPAFEASPETLELELNPT